MLLVHKDKKKLAVQKGRIWNREIKFVPVLVFGIYEGVGNASITLWKPLNNYDVTLLRNEYRRKQRKTPNKSKPRRKSQSVTPYKNLVPKLLETVNGKSSAKRENKSNKEELIGYSSIDNNNSINDTGEGRNKLFKTNSSSHYSNKDKEYYVHNEFTTKSDTLQYIVERILRTEPINERFYPHNLIEYPGDNEGENNVFKTHLSSDYSNQNEEYLMKSDLDYISNSKSTIPNAVIMLSRDDKEDNKLFQLDTSSDQNNEHVSNQIIKESESLKNIPDKMMEADLNTTSNNERISLNNVVVLPTDGKEENKLFESHTLSYYINQNEEYLSSQFINKLEALKNIPDKLIKPDLNNIPNNVCISSEDAIILPWSDKEERRLFELYTSDDKDQNKDNVSSQFINESETLKNISDKLMESDINKISNNESNELIKFLRDNKEENKLFESHTLSDYKNQNKEYISTQLIKDSETLTNIPDKLVETDTNNISNNESIFPNNLISLKRDDKEEDKLFESHPLCNANQNKEYVSSKFTTQLETSKNMLNEPMKSDLNNIANSENNFPNVLVEFPSDDMMIYPNTSQYTSPHSTTFISLENLVCDSDEFYQNLRKNWSLGSSKILMTPSRQSINSDNSSTSVECDSVKADKYPTIIEPTQKHFVELLNTIGGNLNDIINDHQIPEQNILKLQDKEERNLNDFRKDQQFMDQTDEKNQDGNLKDNQLSNNTYMKFIVLKKSRDNQETILDSSEDIEKNIFTRNKISPCFKDLSSNSVLRTCCKERKLLQEENETDNTASSKTNPVTDHSHNYGEINNKTRIELPKDCQEANRLVFNNKNLVYSNNLTEDEIVKHLFNNENIQTSDENLHKTIGGESKYVISLKSSEDDEKDSSFIQVHAAQKCYKPQPECTTSLLTTLSKTETLYFEEMMEQDLELASEETSEKATINTNKNIVNEKNMVKKENINNIFFKHDKTNRPSSSADPKNNFQTQSKEAKDLNNDLLYHLASESNHKINDYERTFSEINKRTDEMINKIIRAKTQEELLVLMKLKQKHPERENTEKNNIEEALVKNGLKSDAFVDKKETKCNIVSENNHNAQSIHHSSLKDNITKKVEEEPGKAKIYKKFTSSYSSLEKSVNNLQSIATPSSKVKFVNQMPENFRFISEEKEESSQIMNLKINGTETNLSQQCTVMNDSSSDENSTPATDKNIYNTNLYFANHVIKSPYIPSYSEQKTKVNERKNSLQEKMIVYFKKLNFWSKRKSTTSFRSNSSNSEN